MSRFGLLALPLALFAACQCARPPAPAFVPPADSLDLGIPDRPWAAGAPDEGWCGEASIQMAALHFGAYVPQATINRLGRPKGPDLWEDDVPKALDALGLRYEAWAEATDLGPFLRWIEASLRQRRPVVLGVKIYPTEHADWNVDHLVLAQGFAPGGLSLDTNMGDRQILWSWKALQSSKRGYSLVGPAGRQYGYAILGFAPAPRSVPVSASVAGETPEDVGLQVRIAGLEAGKGYVLIRDDLAGNTTRTPVARVSDVSIFPVEVRASEAARFTCVEAD
jgi:hypothetical protein